MVGALQRLLFPVLCIVQCSSLALHNAYGLFTGALPRLQRVVNAPPLRAYGRLTGSGTAHGFFAPQVASMLILQLRREAAGDTVCWNGPALRTASGRTRYVAFLNYCQYLRAGADTVDAQRHRQVQAIVRRLIRAELPPQAARPTRCIVYAVDPVPLGTPAGGGRPRLAIVYDALIRTETP